MKGFVVLHTRPRPEKGNKDFHLSKRVGSTLPYAHRHSGSIALTLLSYVTFLACFRRMCTVVIKAFELKTKALAATDGNDEL